MTQIPALVVGTGFGCRIHVPALRAAGFDVVGLVGTRPDKLERKARESGVPAFFTDLDEAITKTGAQVVTVATTPATHARLALQAISHGCHVLCEKPFAFDAEEGARLVEAAEEAGVVNMVAHEFRWQPDRALFGRAIAEGMIGEPRFLVLDQFIPFCADPEARLPRWWFDKEAGGGWLGAGGSHVIDQVRAWFGDFLSLSANLLTVSDRQDVADDTFSMRFLLENGLEGSMQQSAGAWGPPSTNWRCIGNRGTIWLDGGKVHVADKSGARELEMPGDLELPPAPDQNPANRMAQFELRPFTRLCEALKSEIEGTTASSSIRAATFRDGLASMRVMDAMRASARAGGAIQTV